MSEKQKLTRAELVRQRRAERLKKQSAPTVTVRAPKPNAPRKKKFALPRKKNSEKTSRTYESALPATAKAPILRVPALHLPKIEIRLSGRWLSFFVAAFLAAGLYGMATSSLFAAAPPQVTGNERIPESQIQLAMGITGQPVFLLQPEALARDLRLTLPELSSVSVRIAFPNRVLVHVTERQPLLAWQENGKITWIDAEGVAFLPDGQAENLIPVTAFAPPPATHTIPSDPLSPPPYLSPDLVAMLQTLAAEAPANATLFYDSMYGVGWHDPRGWTVYFGTDGQNVEMQLRVYNAIVDYLAKKGLHPVMINVAYPDNPYYRLEQ